MKIGSEAMEKQHSRQAGEPTRSTPHTSEFCPNCSARLLDHRCELKCPQCGFFLSCSDFY